MRVSLEKIQNFPKLDGKLALTLLIAMPFIFWVLGK
jgi:hypothetical protein